MNIREQIKHEQALSVRDANKYYRKQDALRDKTLGDQVDSASYIIRNGVLDVAVTLEDFATRKTRGVGGKYNALLRNVAARIGKDSEIYYDYGAVAFIGLQAIFQGLTRKHGNTWHALAHTIATRLEADHKARLFEAHEPAYFNRVLKSFSEQMIQQYQHKHRVIMMKFNEFDIEWTPWNANEKIQVANKVLIAILHTLPDILFKNKYMRVGKVVLTIDTLPGADDWFAEFERESGFMRPSHPPLLVQPINWERNEQGDFTGGYYTPTLARTLPFVKTRSQEHRDYLKNFPIEEHRQAINKMQATAWKINKEVLAVQTEMFKKQLGNGLPKYQPKELPEFPPHIAPIPNNLWTETQQDEVAVWKGVSKRIHTQNRIQKGKVLAYKSTADIAREYQNYEAFYFAYNADFRGRIYCATSGLSPQGEDLAKGLLTFQTNVPNGQTGLFWLAVQGANTFGFDKVSYEDRVNWIYEQEQQLRDTIRDPISTRSFWGSADKPWQFLAFIFAWAKTNYGQNPDSTSSLPIGLDGSCNGIQHYSAILRDSVGGRAVNLTDSEIPSDIYQDVADVLLSKLNQIAETSGHPTSTYAKLWLNAGLDRKLTKRPVMTLPYGSTRQSCKEYIYEWMLDHRNKFPDDDRELFQIALFLTPLVWDSIGEVVIAARAAMTWLQTQAVQSLKEHKESLTWISPASFPVYQNYMKTKTVRIDTMIAGSINARVQISSGVPTDIIDNRKQRLGIAPNFIHSVDSSHMVKTINASNFPAYAMIHDDFGTHAGNTEALWKQIRVSFVDMYQQYNPLEDWQNDQHLEFEADLPPQGDLEITKILTSTFFFG